MAADDRIGIWAETGGDLSKDRTLFRFGKRVESVHLTNGTAAARKFDIQVARDPQFYLPFGSPNGQLTRREVNRETYFYVIVPANSSYSSPPFFARRGLKVKSQNTSNCSADAIVYGVEEGDCLYKDLA